VSTAVGSRYPVVANPQMRIVPAAAALLSLAVPTPAPVVKEPKTGVTFEAKVGDMSLLGVGLRTKTFLKFKVYALGLYVADSALSGPLTVHRGKVGTSAFYQDLIAGDFEKQFVLKLVRDLSAEQIRGTFRSHMPSADPKLLDQFVSYFGATKAGQECVLRWVPGGRLEATVGGVAKPPIADKAFADAVFAIWLGDRPAEDPIRKQVVSRARQLLK
jgi:Chalcone isomerase-like